NATHSGRGGAASAGAPRGAAGRPRRATGRRGARAARTGRPRGGPPPLWRARVERGGARRREAALQLRIAREAGLAELEPWRDSLGERLAELRDARRGVPPAANRPLPGGIGDDT